MSVFEKHPKVTMIVLWGIGLLCLVGALEWTARTMGLGDVIVYESSPIYGYKPVRDQNVTRFKGASIRINHQGLRSTQAWSDNPSNKILFLGDSVTYGGSYIDDHQLFSELAIKDTSWVSGNAGVNGWGVLNVHGFIKEMEYTPARIYVSLFPEGDFYRGLNRIGGQPFWATKPKWALEELAHYGLYRVSLKKIPSYQLGNNPDLEKKRIASIAARHLKELDEYLKSKGFVHLIYISPSKTQSHRNAKIDPIVKAVLDEHQVKASYLLDKVQLLSSENVDELFHDEIHLTPQGHAQWAQWIREDLEAYLG